MTGLPDIAIIIDKHKEYIEERLTLPLIIYIEQISSLNWKVYAFPKKKTGHFMGQISNGLRVCWELKKEIFSWEKKKIKEMKAEMNFSSFFSLIPFLLSHSFLQLFFFFSFLIQKKKNKTFSLTLLLFYFLFILILLSTSF